MPGDASRQPETLRKEATAKSWRRLTAIFSSTATTTARKCVVRREKPTFAKLSEPLEAVVVSMATIRQFLGIAPIQPTPCATVVSVIAS